MIPHKWSLILIMVSLLPLLIRAQVEERPRHAFFLELAGSGGLGSINYERLWGRADNIQYSFRAGFSLAPIDRNNGTGLVFPLLVNVHYGNGTHTLEAGLGQGITLTTRGGFFSLLIGAVGYRYQPNGKRLFLRVAYTPLISYLIDWQVQHWGGVSLGFYLNQPKP